MKESWWNDYPLKWISWIVRIKNPSYANIETPEFANTLKFVPKLEKKWNYPISFVFFFLPVFFCSEKCLCTGYSCLTLITPSIRPLTSQNMHEYRTIQRKLVPYGILSLTLVLATQMPFCIHFPWFNFSFKLRIFDGIVCVCEWWLFYRYMT